jgi:endonuclease/exonuclease/phosphatase family metal-dependent hydrolase
VKNTILKIKPDIIAMQEVLLSDGVDYSRVIADQIGYYHVSSIPYQNIRNGDKWVLSFLSKYRFTKVDQKQLDKYRRVLKVYIKFNDRTICLATTHLSPMVWSDNLYTSNVKRSEMRIRELNQLLDFITEQDIPVFILGDFNVRPGSDIHDSMNSRNYSDVGYRPVVGNKYTFKIADNVVKKLKAKLPDFIVPEEVTLDYIFMKGNIKAVSVDVLKINTSDHYPLIGSFVLQ